MVTANENIDAGVKEIITRVVVIHAPLHEDDAVTLSAAAIRDIEAALLELATRVYGEEEVDKLLAEAVKRATDSKTQQQYARAVARGSIH